MKKGFYCLLWLYPKSEQRMGFVVCCNESCFLLVISRARNIKRKELLLYWLFTEQNIDICCSLEYIQSIEKKCLLLLCSIEEASLLLFCLYPEPRRSVALAVILVIHRNRKNSSSFCWFDVIQYLEGCPLKDYNSL